MSHNQVVLNTEQDAPKTDGGHAQARNSIQMELKLTKLNKGYNNEINIDLAPSVSAAGTKRSKSKDGRKRSKR